MTKPNTTPNAIQKMPNSPELAAALVAQRYRRDPRLRRQFDEQPRMALEQILRRRIASNIQVLTHKNTDDTWHLPLPSADLPDLSDDQLAEVSAGELIFLGVAIGGAVTVGLLGLAVGIAVPLSDK